MFKNLKTKIKGDLFTDKIRTYLHSSDGSIFRVQPICVVYPKDTHDVTETVHFASRHGLSIHSRGAGSGLCGSAIGNGIVLDFTKYMNRLIHIDLKEKWFECEPGYRLGELEAALNGKGLFFPPDPSSGEYATFGGMYGTNASGAHSVKYGNVSDYILDAEVILSTGNRIILSHILEKEYEQLPDYLKKLHTLYTENAKHIETAYPPIRYNVSGYNLRGLVHNPENNFWTPQLDLRRLFAGSEGTLGIVTRLKFRLLDKPPYDSLVVAFSDDILSSAQAVQKILPMEPAGIEIMDKSLLELAKKSDEHLRDKIPVGIDNVLMIEFDAFDKDESMRLANEAKQLLISEGFTRDAHLAVSDEEKEKFWAIRKAAVPILYKLKGEKKILALLEDAAVPIRHLVAYFQGIYDILNRHQVRFVLYGHIAKGLLHTRPLLNLKAARDVGMLRILGDEVFELVHSLGGSISGEHGDGRLRSAYIKKQYPGIYDLFLKIKQIFDEKNILNPEIKTIHDPNQMKKNLRFGADYQITYHFPFFREIEKCHGCSKCTTITTATRMCPIYKFTRDESAAPKSKANILQALISGAISEKNLYEKAFYQVMQQCVHCGSCYKECPSNVNIPQMAITAKAEYIKRFGPTIQDRLLVSAELAGRAAKKFSRILKPLAENKISRKIGEQFLGISAKRKLIAFPEKSLFERRAIFAKGQLGKKVLFFAGCYAGYIKPEIGMAAIKTLRQIGMSVLIPKQHCCGLPMISKGMIRPAKNRISKNLRKWGSLLNDIDHIVVTCSSCGFSLMQEWAYLFDNHEIKDIQQKTIHISTLVNQHLEKLEFNASDLSLSYHMPCHLKVQPDANSSLHMLSKIEGLRIGDLKSHCCGMAGSWGFSADHYDLSCKIGSDMIHKLNIADSVMGITDCPTCRLQMEHLSEKEIRHPIEIVADLLKT